MKVDFKIFKPGGNITALVEGDFTAQQKVDISKQIMFRRKEVEQVGFVESEEGKLEMMGGELCLNAMRSMALLRLEALKKDSTLLYSDVLQGPIKAFKEKDKIFIEVPNDLVLNVSKMEDGSVVDLKGIKFFISEKKDKDPRSIISACDDGLVPAIGVGFFKKENEEVNLIPWVWVRGTDTFVAESSCGSGSLALWKVISEEADIKTLKIKQPSGATLEIRRGSRGVMELGGEVQKLGSDSLEIKETGCIYCGAQQVSHGMEWFNEAVTLGMTWFDRSFSGSIIHRSWDRYSSYLASAFFFAARLLRVSDKNTDKEKIFSGRARVIWDEAEKRGIKMASLRILKKEIECYEARVDKKKMVFQGLPKPVAKEGDGLWWIDDKAYLKEKLQMAGVPVPRGGSAFTLKRAREIFSLIQKPAIVKPRFGSRGRHSLTYIHTMKDLDAAFKIAKQLCPAVIVEEHLVGDVFRGTVVNGKLVGVLGGSPPRILGDGKSTVLDLVQKKNSEKKEGQGDIRITKATEEFLERRGYKLSSILKKGEVLDMTEKIGVRYGGESEELTPVTHPKIVRALESAAAVVKSPVVGFDFIIQDIRKDPAYQKWGIIECNSMPFINLHHDPLIGEPVNAAGAVWEAVLADK